MSYFSDGNWLPTGTNSINDNQEYPKLSSRIPVEISHSDEDQPDDGTNGTGSNSDCSSDEGVRPSIEMPPTRMAEESDEDDGSQPAKVIKARLVVAYFPMIPFGSGTSS